MTPQYAVSNKEDTAYPCFHFTRYHKEFKFNTPYPEDLNTPYPRYSNKIFWKILNVLEEEKARRDGQVYNWEIATYGKIWYDEDVHYLRSFEKEFPAIVYKDALKSEQEIPSEPTVSYFNDFNYFKDFEKEFLSIAYNDALTLDSHLNLLYRYGVSWGMDTAYRLPILF
ncbi:hypothetical protein Tco_0843316 [Tanacetum coccineum]|uniref:Uncharacterized protein n=1 Tax=Tanacetum coccineum TaxID=301880 RepID=A0ABQ5B3H7_9ASTR